jgi:4-amino-4-deoxychorismate lyase
LQIWRKPGGLYTPEDNKFEMLLTVKPLGLLPYVTKTAGFSEKVTLSHSFLSRHKTCNSLPYILAALEKEKRELNELVLLDNNGNVAECISSNIFWRKKNTFYTPSLETGCIAGVMRKNVIKILKGNGFEVKKVKAKKKSLLEADTIFSSNANGLFLIEKLEDKIFNIELEKCLLPLQ